MICYRPLGALVRLAQCLQLPRRALTIGPSPFSPLFAGWGGRECTQVQTNVVRWRPSLIRKASRPDSLHAYAADELLISDSEDEAAPQTGSLIGNVMLVLHLVYHQVSTGTRHADLKRSSFTQQPCGQSIKFSLVKARPTAPSAPLRYEVTNAYVRPLTKLHVLYTACTHMRRLARVGFLGSTASYDL